MAGKFQIRRGTDAVIPLLAEGEFGFAVNSGHLYIGGLNGLGNILIGPADGYATNATVSEHYQQHSDAIQTILKDLDGYGAGGGVTSAQGADGYVAFFTGSGAIAGDNDLFFDRVNNNLRIGIASGSAKLQVGKTATTAGATVTIAQFSGGDVASHHHLFQATGAGGYTTTYDQNDTGLHIGHNSTSRNIQFETGSLNRLEIQGTGDVRVVNDLRVGSGIMAGANVEPVNPLDVEGAAVIGASYSGSTTGPANGLLVQGRTALGISANTTSTLIVNDNGLATTSVADFSADDGAPWLVRQIREDVTSAFVNTFIDGSGHFSYTNQHATGDFYWAAGGSERLRIEGDTGRVGIGTSSPGSTLELEDTGVVRLDVTNTGTGTGDVALIRVYMTDAGEQGNIAMGHWSNSYSGTSGDFPLAGSSTISANGGSRLNIRTANGAPINFSTDTHAMTISALQHVGIGTTLPIERLTVDGVIALSEQGATPANEDGYGKLWVDSAGELNYVDDNSNSVRITLAGAVDAAGGGGGVTSAQGSDGYVAFFTGSDAIAGDNDLFFDRVNNRLGIGTTAPASALQLGHSTSGAPDRLQIHTHGVGFHQGVNINSSQTTDTGSFISVFHGVDVNAGSVYQEMRITDNGAAHQDWAWGINTADDSFRIAAATGTNTAWPAGADSVQKFVILPTGAIGIGDGNVTPDNKLHVVDTDIGLKVERQTTTDATTASSLVLTYNKTNTTASDESGTGMLFQLQDTGGGPNSVAGIAAVREGALDSGALVFKTATTGSLSEAMRIGADGQVGINTASPTKTLQLGESGSGVADGLRIETHGTGFHQSINLSSNNITDTGAFLTGQFIDAVANSVYHEMRVTDDGAAKWDWSWGINTTGAQGSQGSFRISSTVGTNAAWPASGTANAHKLVILPESGNVGLGTTQPMETLTVNGAIALESLSSGISRDHDGYGVMYVDSGTNLIYRKSQNAETVFNVFNGTNDTAAGATLLLTSSGNNFRMRSYSDNHSSRADENWIETTAGSTDVIIATASTERMRFVSDGYVLPGADDTQSLGSPSKRWESLFLGPDSLHFVTTDGETGAGKDWRIGVGTDSGKGFLHFHQGGNKRLVLTDGGRMGLGTDNPTAAGFEVASDDNTPQMAVVRYAAGTNDRGTIDFKKARGTKDAPTAVQSGDLLGTLGYSGHTGTAFQNAASIDASATETWSGSAEGSLIKFQATKAGETTRAERMSITGDDVRIGSSTSKCNLQFHDGASAYRDVIRNGSSIYYIGDVETLGGDGKGVTIRTGGGDAMIITNAGSNSLFGLGRTPTTNTLEVDGAASKTTAETWLANSDRRIKTDIKTIENGLDIIKQLNPVSFKYIEDYKEKHPTIKDYDYYNYIAQEYKEVFPNSVQDSGEDGILQIETGSVTPHLVSAVQELVEIIEKQNKTIDSLEKRLEELEKEKK